jgi:sorting nexin-25
VKPSVNSKPQHWLNNARLTLTLRRLISKVRNVLESQSPRRNPQVPEAAAPTTETITLRTDVRQFESFLRSIGRISSLLDARRMKNDIDNEIRRTRALLCEFSRLRVFLRV